MQFQSDSQRESYDDFPKFTCLGCNSGVCKNPKCLGLYLQKYNKPRFAIQSLASTSLLLKWVLIPESETLNKNNYSKHSMMTYLRSNSRAYTNPNFLISYL